MALTQIYVDMDGVLADFDQHYEDMFGYRPDKLRDDVDWSLISDNAPNFYANIPPMSDMRELWDFVLTAGHRVGKFGLHKEPIVLTGVPWSIRNAAQQKRRWVHKHLGENVMVLCCPSKDKCVVANPGDILIDDWEKYRHLWEEKGGRWITHTSAASTIQQLKEMGVSSNGSDVQA